MNAPPERKLSPRNRVIASIAIFTVFYFNVAEVLQVSCVEFTLPRPAILREPFRMFTLWASYTQWNSSYEAEAVVVGAQDEQGDPLWVVVDVHQYLPSVRADANRLLVLDDGSESLAPDDPRRVQIEHDYARVIEVLQRCYNRDHPDQQIDHMRLYLSWWPSNRLGYFHDYEQRSRRLLYAKP